MPAKDPLRNFRYRLAIDGIVQAGFSEAAIADGSNDPIECREGNETTTVRQLPGLNKYGNITQMGASPIPSSWRPGSAWWWTMRRRSPRHGGPS